MSEVAVVTTEKAVPAKKAGSSIYQFKRKAVDPVTFQVIYHRLISITEEQAATLAAISGSPLVNEATDYNTGIFRANGEIVTMVSRRVDSRDDQVHHRRLRDQSRNPPGRYVHGQPPL